MQKKEIYISALCTLALGIGMHFVHHVPFFTHAMGYVFPFYESVWEHMKLFWFPMLLLSAYMAFRERNIGVIGGYIAATLIAVPVTAFSFFSYWSVVGHDVPPVDIVIFTIVMLATIQLGHHWSKKSALQRLWPLWIVVAVAMCVWFAYCAYNAPDFILFRELA